MSATPAPANPSSQPTSLSPSRAVEFRRLKILRALHCLLLRWAAWSGSAAVGTRQRRMVTGFALALIAIAISVSFLNTHAKAAPNAKHGLIGQYYVSQLPAESPTEHRLYFTQIWTNKDDFQLPQPLTDPAVVRVDPQIAFGQGKGFASATVTKHHAAWAPADYPNPPGWGADLKPSDYFAAAIWRGYIHLPKAGTYYFATVSSGPSAVYLNQSRVALNGPGSGYGGLLTSDNFTYDTADVKDFTENVRGTPFAKRIEDAYAISVTVERPRDLPIEVRYNAWRTPSGIDLLWVTPDAPRDASGKPLAKLVPSDALYTEAPGPIEKPVVRSANSTISADLYCSAVEDNKPLTLSIRLADKEGRPVAGKRVVFVTLADDKFGYDDTFQPEKPTDENGIATAQVRATSGARGHDSTIYATDVTDLVDVGQVAHVRFPHVENSSFLRPCSGGYDPNIISVEPLPMVVGRPLTLRVRLENRQKSDAELNATFQANDWNIGATTWNDVGKVDNIHLKPGESKDVSVTWTPKVTEGHQCFRVQLKGGVKAANRSTAPVLATTLLSPTNLLPLLADTASGNSDAGSAQHNVGSVSPCNFDPSPIQILGRLPTGLGHCKPNLAQKDFCRQAAEAEQGASDVWYTIALRDKSQKSLEGLKAWNDTAQKLLQCYVDPPNSSYQRLAAALSDTPAGYIEALTKSMERYEGAQANGDLEWMAKHNTALELYEKRLAESLRRQADQLQKKAEQLPPDDPSALSKQQAEDNELITRLRQGRRLTPDESGVLQDAGLAEDEIKAFVSRLVQQKELPPLAGPRALLLDQARLARQSADGAERLAGTAVASEAQPNQSFVQSYSLANPHDREEDVHLSIRPIAIPMSWKLSVTNAAPEQATGQNAATPAAAPQFPVTEAAAGKEYIVHLPAKGQIKVVSVLVPVGELGANTTARWAVEGKIGDEVIGTMVHEMNVPYIVADLKLPAVGSKEEVDQPAEQPTHKRSSLEIAITAGAVVIIAILAFVLLRRRRQAPAA